MERLLKILFFALVARPVVLIALGLNIRWRERLPSQGPAVICANHNSHLDTLVLMSLYPLSMIHKVRPVAAADYFLAKGGLMAWFSTKVMGIIPLDRSGKADKSKLFEGCHQALAQGDILLVFPEGSRGKPEQMSRIKKGLYYLIKDAGEVTTTPVLMRGLGRALPKGEALFVPFNCDVIVGEPIANPESAQAFTGELEAVFRSLAEHTTIAGTDADRH